MKYLVHRLEKNYKSLIIEAPSGDEAVAIGEKLDYDEYQDEDGMLHSETFTEGEADAQDLKEVPIYEPPEGERESEKPEAVKSVMDEA